MRMQLDDEPRQTTEHDPATAPTDELPLVLNDLVPLSLVIDRSLFTAYTELSNLAETLPSTKDAERKKAIVDHVLSTRRQILKLLVLVRWAKEAHKVQKCMNIVGFLAGQNFEIERAGLGLEEMRRMLAGARVRNYDLPTAITVLSTGTYQALPPEIYATFADPPTLSDKVVLDTLEEMNRVLRFRLALRERMPTRMKGYTIQDGRVKFVSEGVWEAEMTYGGEEQGGGQWYALSVKFLFRVRDARGVWASIPKGPVKDGIINLCNLELARREITTGSDEAVDQDQDAPLVRGYNFLQRLALGYQIEALYTQALQLAATSWTGNLKVALNKERNRLSVEYWSNIQSTPKTSQGARPALPLPPTPVPTVPVGTLIISYSPPVSRITDDDSSRSDQAQAGLMQEGLRIEWEAPALDEATKGSVDLAFDSELSVESLLRSVTCAHARFEVLQLYKTLLSSDQGLPASNIVLDNFLAEDDQEGLQVQVRLHEQHFVLVKIDDHSGRLILKALGDVSTTREARLRGVMERTNDNRGAIGENLLRIKASTILDEVESRAVYLGYPTLRRLQLRPVDLAKFGQTTRYCLYIQLQALPTSSKTGEEALAYYLVLILTDEGFRFSIISVRRDEQTTQTALVLGQIGSLKFGPEPFGFELGLEDLRKLQARCSRRIGFLKIESQLAKRGIPYQFVTSPVLPDDQSEGVTLGDEELCLALKSRHLSITAGGGRASASENVAIQLVPNPDSTNPLPPFQISMHVNYPLLARLPPQMSYELAKKGGIKVLPKSGTVVFVTEQLEDCVRRFLEAFEVVGNVVGTLETRGKRTKKVPVLE